jgi:hypothetical protein
VLPGETGSFLSDQTWQHAIIVQHQRDARIIETLNDVVRDGGCYESLQNPHNVIQLQINLVEFVYSQDKPLRNGEDAQIKHLELIRRVW